MNTAETIYGDVQTGDWVIAAGNNDYRYLIGAVREVNKLGTPEHGTDNETDDVHVDFTVFDYPPERIAEIEEQFSELYDEPKVFDELPLDDVIMAPKMLISISNLSHEEIERMGNLRHNCEAFCNSFPGGEHESERYTVLIERIEKNYADYQQSLMGFGKSELIEMASKIHAMSDAHSYMTCWYNFDEHELDFYLNFQNPLEVVANEWRDRNIDLADMSFTLEHLYGNSDDLLEDYPLMSDIDTLSEPGLRRYMDIDLELYLGMIAEKVILHHPNDWNIDKETLHRAAISGDPEDKRLMWHVSSWGTHLNTERETFIKDTGAFNTWVDYRPRDEDMFGYVIEVTGYEGRTIKGNVFEVGDYYNHSLYVRENAQLLNSVSLTYSDVWGVNAGKTITVPRYEYDNDRHRLMSESGNVTAIRYHPWEGIKKMSELLRHERAKQMALPLGSAGELLRKMADRLAEVRQYDQPAQIAQDVEYANLYDNPRLYSTVHVSLVDMASGEVTDALYDKAAEYAEAIDKAIKSFGTCKYWGNDLMRDFRLTNDYQTEKAIRGKIYGAFLTVHPVGDTLFAALDLKMTQDFTATELEVFTKQIESQFRNGWGEAFELKNIPVSDENAVCMRLHHDDLRFYTADEFAAIAEKLSGVRAEPEKPPADKKIPIGERIKAGNEKVKAYKENKAQNPQTTKNKKEEITQ